MSAARVRLSPNITTAARSAARSVRVTAWSAKGRNDGNRWVDAIAVVKGRNETNSKSSRLSRMSPRSVALTNRVM